LCLSDERWTPSTHPFRRHSYYETLRKLASLRLLLQSDDPLERYPGFKYKICANIITAFRSTWRQTTAVVNQARTLSCRQCGQLLQTQCDARHLLFTIVVNRPTSIRTAKFLLLFQTSSSAVAERPRDASCL